MGLGFSHWNNQPAMGCGGNIPKYTSPNPNPDRFLLKGLTQVGKNLVAVIQYLDCTNFEGIKVLVYKDLLLEDIKKIKTIDPHFAEEGLVPFARFLPTAEGIQAAMKLAEIL